MQKTRPLPLARHGEIQLAPHHLLGPQDDLPRVHLQVAEDLGDGLQNGS